MTRRSLLALVTALTALTAVLAGCTGTPAVDPFGPFVAGWQRGDLTGVALRSPDGQPLAAADAGRLLTDVYGDLAGRRPVVTRHGVVTVERDNAATRAGVDWVLPGGRHWSYEVTLDARRIDGRWAVYLGPQTVHPGLDTGRHLSLRTEPAARGTVTAGDGTEIVRDTPVVYVGVEPRLVTDAAALVQRLELVFRSVRVPVDVTGLPARLKAAKPDAFLDVATLRRSDYDDIAGDLTATGGVRTRNGSLSLPMTRTFARALLGLTGPATKEMIDASAGVLSAGDVAGLGGLQRRYDTRLRGTPGLAVLAAGGKAAPVPLYDTGPVAGATVRTTLDVRTQQAAEAALAATTRRSALVALRVSDGAVLAVADGPDAADYNLAFLGQFSTAAPGVDGAAAGFGGAWQAGLDVYGHVDGTGVTGSPLGYAAAAAALARGHWRAPVLVLDPPQAPAGDGPAVTGTLTVPAATVGVHGDVAYCVYVEGAGKDVTDPIAAAFLTATGS